MSYRGKSPNQARTPNPADGTGIDNVFVPLPPKNSKQGIEFQKRKIRAYSKELAVPVVQHNSANPVAPRSPAYTPDYPTSRQSHIESPAPDSRGHHHQQQTYKLHQLTSSSEASPSFGRVRTPLRSREASNEPDELIPSMGMGAKIKTPTRQYTPERLPSFGGATTSAGAASSGKLRGMTPDNYEPPPKRGKGRPLGSKNKARSVSKQPNEPPKEGSRAPSTASNTGRNPRGTSRQAAEPPTNNQLRGRTPQLNSPTLQSSNNSRVYTLEDYEKCAVHVEQQWKLLEKKLRDIEEIKSLLKKKINDFQDIMTNNYSN